MIRPQVTDALQVLSDAIVEAEENSDRDELLRLWRECDEIVAELRTMASVAESAVVPLMPWIQTHKGKRVPSPVIVDGLPSPVTVAAKSNKTTWDHDATARRVIAAGIDAGQILSPADAVNVVRQVAHIDYWRTTQLKALGIDADDEDLREVERDRRGLRLL